MVNDVNKPSSSQFAQLNERLTASNHHLLEMQEEHRELLQEIESLRERASMLTRMNAESHMSTTTTTSDESITAASSSSSSSSVTATATCRSAISNTEILSQAEQSDDAATSSAVNTPKETLMEDDPEEADFIRSKLNEIAALKSQLHRVQHLNNTTKLIEEHISSHSSIQRSDTLTSSSSSSSITSSSNARTDIEDAKSELLNTMTSMFIDYASDLRGQAESLRTERERIRSLKEKIIASKRQI